MLASSLFQVHEMKLVGWHLMEYPLSWLELINFTDRGFEVENFKEKQVSNRTTAKLELPSVSTALLLSAIIGIVEALALFFGAGFFLNMMGISAVSLHESFSHAPFPWIFIHSISSFFHVYNSNIWFIHDLFSQDLLIGFHFCMNLIFFN